MFETRVVSYVFIWESIFLAPFFVAISEQSPSYADLEEEDIEEEFKKLELTICKEAQVPEPENASISAEEKQALEATEFINHALSNLKLSDNLAGSKGEKVSNNPAMEAV